MSRRKVLLSVIICALLIFLFVRGLDWAALKDAFVEANKGLVGLAMLAWLVGHGARALRWAVLLDPARGAHFGNVFTATQVGSMMNILVPARAGELIRILLLSYRDRIAAVELVGSVVLDRVLDLLFLLGLLLAMIVYLPKRMSVVIPENTLGNTAPITFSWEVLVSLGWALGAVVGLLLVALVLVFINHDLSKRYAVRLAGIVSRRLATWVGGTFDRFVNGLNALGSRRRFVAALGYSGVVWFTGLAGTGLMMRAFSIDTSFMAALVVLTVISALVSVPVVPGMIGQYHVAAVIGITIAVPGVSETSSKAVALALHSATLVNIVMLGIGCILAESMRTRSR